MNELLLGALIIFTGAAVQGIVGFGIALVAVPVLMFILPHTQVPPLMVIMGLLNNLIVLSQLWRNVQVRLVAPLMLAGLCGLPLGALLLKYANPAPFKLGLGLLVVLLAAVMLSGWRRTVRKEAAGLATVGLIGGVLHTATSVSGPPVILFLSNQGLAKDLFRANLLAFFAVLNSVSIVIFYLYGLMPARVLTMAAWYVLPLLLGSLAGVWLARRIDERLFARCVLVVVAVLGLALVATNLPVLR